MSGRGAAVPVGGMPAGGGASTSTAVVAYKPELRYDGTQDIFAHSMIHVTKSLERVNSGCGRPVTYFNAFQKKHVEGVPQEIKTKYRTTMVNVIKKPQTNNLEKVDEDEYFCDEYDECYDKLLVLDYLDPAYNIALKEPPSDDDYKIHRYNRSINWGYKYEVKQYALVDAYNKTVLHQDPVDRDLPAGISQKSYERYYADFVKNWEQEKMKYVLDNFYDYQRMVAVTDLFYEIARLTAYYSKNADSIVLYRLPQFKYLKLRKFCRSHYFVVADCKKALSAAQRNYYGFHLIDTLEEICKSETYMCPNGKTNAENLREEDIKAKAAASLDSSDDESDAEDTEDDDDNDDEVKQDDSKRDLVSSLGVPDGGVIGFDTGDPRYTDVDAEIVRVEDCGSSVEQNPASSDDERHNDYSPVEQYGVNINNWEEWEQLWTSGGGNGDGGNGDGGNGGGGGNDGAASLGGDDHFHNGMYG